MFKWAVISLLSLTIISSYGWSQETNTSKVVICVRDLDTAPGANLDYYAKSIKASILNRLSQIKNVIVYSGESEPGKYFKEPDKILTADKVQLLQIRRESGFDGLIFGKLEEKEKNLLITLHLVDFSSGRVYFTGEIQDSFGSGLLWRVEKNISPYVDSLIRYYNSDLSVVSDPADAEVWINGERSGITPVNNLEVQDGQLQVQIKKPGYVPYETQIELQAGQKGLIHARLYKYSLTVTSDPSNAEVWINGEKIGVTPIDNLDVKDGQLHVQIKKAGYMPYETQVELQAGQKGLVHTILYRYSLTATSRPEGANVYLDGRIVGVTPLINLPLEQQRFTVEFNKKGFVPYTESISLSTGEQAYIHAELYDLLTSHLRSKKSFCNIDSHNFSFTQTIDIQNLEEISVEAFPISKFSYYASFGRLSAGFGIGVGVLNASQHFDTFLDTGEGYEQFTISMLRGTVFGKYNIINKPGSFGLYLGAFTGFSSTISDQPYAPSDLMKTQKVSPLAGGEIGADFYLARIFKLSVLAGSYYGAKLDYAVKKASYWGEAEYTRKTLELQPFYVGIALTFSIWPSFIQ